MSNLTGQSLGRYHILEQLGEGGMAVVYKAYDTRLESEVAVKVIRTERLSPETLQKALKRFEREAKSLAQLTHPNIVNVLDYGEFEGQPYLVMPYVPGGTLKQLLKGKPMQWQKAARLLIPIARSLDYAHKRGIVHRDIKPSNIMITESGEPMLTDFGVAKIIDEEATLDLTGTSATVGTPEYMAPEQTTSKTTDHRVDIYALGIVLYEMVTGRKPFQADTPLAVLFKHASEPLPRPSQFVTGIPDQVEKILVKALAKKPVDRYQSMGEVAEALDALLSGNIRSPKTSRPKKEFASSLTHEPAPASKRPIALWVSLALVGMAVVGILISWLARGGGTTEVFPTDEPSFTSTPFVTNKLIPTNTVDIVSIIEEFDDPSIFTSTSRNISISGGQAFWNLSRNGGQQFLYRSIPPFNGNVSMTVSGQIDSATNNCGGMIGIGDDPGSGIAISYGWFGGGCSYNGYLIDSWKGITLDHSEENCTFVNKWLWISEGNLYTSELSIENGSASLSVPGVGGVQGTNSYQGSYTTLWVGLNGDGDWPSCSGSFDSIRIEQHP